MNAALLHDATLAATIRRAEIVRQGDPSRTGEDDGPPAT
jgi:hypothetical protein